MPNWDEINKEIQTEINVGKNYANLAKDKVIDKYIDELSEHTGRNTIVYYSAWLQNKTNINDLMINDLDKNGFMAVIHRLDKTKGLDLLLHTPGGDVAATESIIDYLQSIFENNIRVIVPQLAMSGGTMIACCAKEIIMGKHSSLGPIDPQLANGMAANGIIEEFETAKEDIIKNQSLAELWKPILSSYPPAFIGKCKKSIKWAKEIASTSLKNNMFEDEDHTERQNNKGIN